MIFISLLLIVGLFFNFGCIPITEFTPIKNETRMELIKQGKILPVPFKKQDDKNCGIVALYMVLKYLNIHVSIEQLEKKLDILPTGSIIIFDMENFLKRLGINVCTIKGSINDIENSLKRDYPPIVLVNMNMRFSGLDRLHYLVIVGIDEKNRRIYFHGPNKPYIEASFGQFNNWWKGGSHLMLIIGSDMRNCQ